MRKIEYKILDKNSSIVKEKKQELNLKNTVYNKAPLSKSDFDSNFYNILGLDKPLSDVPIPIDIIPDFLENLKNIKVTQHDSSEQFSELKQNVVTFLYNLKNLYWKRLNEQFGIEEEVFNGIIEKIINDSNFDPYIRGEDKEIKLQLQNVLKEFIQNLKNNGYSVDDIIRIIDDVVNNLPIIESDKTIKYRDMTKSVLHELVNFRSNLSSDILGKISARNSTFYKFCNNILDQYYLLLTNAHGKEFDIERNDLLAYFDFSVNSINIVGNGEGNISGSVVWKQHGNFGGYYDFPGESNCYINYGELNDFKPKDAFTVSVLVKPTALQKNEGNIIASNYFSDNLTTNRRGWLLGHRNGDQDIIEFSVYNNQGNIYRTIARGVFKNYLNKWVRITAIYKPLEFLKIFVNERRVGITSSSPSFIDYKYNSHFKVGSGFDNDSSWQGGISDLMLFDRALEDIEVLNLLNLSSEPQYPMSRAMIKGVVGGVYPFYKDEDSGVKQIYDFIYNLYDKIKIDNNYSEFDVYKNLKMLLNELEFFDNAVLYKTKDGGLIANNILDFELSGEIDDSYYINHIIGVNPILSNITTPVLFGEIKWDEDDSWKKINLENIQSHVYTKPGYKNIILRITLNNGNRDVVTQTKSIYIEDIGMNIKHERDMIFLGMPEEYYIDKGNYSGDINEIVWEFSYLGSTNESNFYISNDFNERITHIFNYENDFLKKVRVKVIFKKDGSEFYNTIFDFYPIDTGYKNYYSDSSKVAGFNLELDSAPYGTSRKIFTVKSSNFVLNYNGVDLFNWITNNYQDNNVEYRYRIEGSYTDNDGNLKRIEQNFSVYPNFYDERYWIVPYRYRDSFNMDYTFYVVIDGRTIIQRRVRTNEDSY